MLHSLENAPGSKKDRKRVGRGPGSTLGKTCGRGHNGQKSRSGSKSRIGFEGGQMPIHRRIPKRGFTNIHRVEYACVNISKIVSSKRLDLKEIINMEALIEAGILKNKKQPLKILGFGTIDKAIKIEADKFSQVAEKKIVDAGGSVTKNKLGKA